MKDLKLIDKTCIPCQGKTVPLNANEKGNFLRELGEGWSINKSDHLYKEYTFKNFAQAMQFANKIAEIAENEGHHPDITISWGKSIVEIWTHRINAITESDFILAAKIEALD